MARVFRPPVKHDAIVRHFRRRIVAGTFRTGQRLPSRRDIARRFPAASCTVQSALDELIATGFVTARGPAGSFVADAPPHLTDYALVFPTDPANEESPQWLPFYHALQSAAEELRETAGRRFHVSSLRSPLAVQEQLRQQVRQQRIGGVIFLCETWPAEELKLLQATQMPRVAVLHSAGAPGMPAVRSDNCDFITQALAKLAAAGQRRIGLVASELAADEREHFDREIARRHLVTRPYWCVRTGRQEPAAIRDLVHLLMHDPRQRPEALLVLNEYSLPGTLAGLAAAGARIGRDVELAVYRLYPMRARYALPLHRFFYDARHILRECLRLLDRQRAGQPVPPTTSLPPIPQAELFEPRQSVAVVATAQGKGR